MIWLIILAAYLWLMGIWAVAYVNANHGTDYDFDFLVWTAYILWPVSFPILLLMDKISK